VKFTWFHLMPYRWLPDDFRQKYHSVWVDLPNGLYDPEKGHDLYNEYLDQLEYAEQCGFDAIAVNEPGSSGGSGASACRRSCSGARRIASSRRRTRRSGRRT